MSDIAAAATSAFSTLPSAPPRVLEDSFTKPAEITLPPAAVPSEVSPPLTSSPVVAAPMPEPVPEVIPTPAPEASPVFTAPAWDVPPEPAPLPEPFIPAAPTPLPAPEAVSAPAPAPLPEIPMTPTAEAAPLAGAPFEFQPSRPDDSPHKRRVREKRPRDFTAMGTPENQQPERPKPMTAFAAHVPVDTRPLDQVGEGLIAGGVMPPKPGDSLTGSLPTSLAETTFAPLPEPAYAPEPITPTPQPAPVAAPIIAPLTAPVVAAPVLPEPPAPEPAPVIARAPEPDPIPDLPAIPTPLPVAPQPTPSFLASNAPLTSGAMLPPPQSDLPWTQPQSTAEWEIETPETTGWGAESGHDASSTPAAHMPSSTADLYKPLGGPAPAQMPLSGIPTRSGGHFTPELPGQRRKSHGTPWALLAVGALVAVGAGAYFLRSGGDSQAQQQLANLTTPAPANDPNAMLEPPRTENASFYTPPSALNSSTAVVNFADIPPEQAGQPIVAEGAEGEMPKDMSLFAQLQSEVEKARQRKEAGLPADTSATTVAQTGATPDAAYTKQKFEEEMAAYRSALAQSPNPSALTPGSFRKDPDGYMDGKPQTTEAAGTPMASGALLPPPSGAAGAALPPPELYTNNPNNLPVVAEPAANAPARVRTLADFPDIEPYAPEKEKVEIPRNLKPKMAATDFPALEVLSFVPGKGIVAFADGREGVLLIGESINGWELVTVAPDNAEFKAGQKSYQVTAEN